MVESSPNSAVLSARSTETLLSPGEIHVWVGSVDVQAEHMSEWGSILSNTELERANKFLENRDRTRFVARRVLLRRLLAHYLGVAAVEIEFSQNRFGKPEIDKPLHAGDVSFNLSHSGEYVVIAVGRGVDVGVDVEQVRPLENIKGLVQTFFSAPERMLYERTSMVDREQLFFEHWVCKEAALKALGCGLSLPAHKVSVSILDGHVSVGCDAVPETKMESMAIKLMAPAAGCVAAIASVGEASSIRSFQLASLPDERSPARAAPRRPK